MYNAYLPVNSPELYFGLLYRPNQARKEEQNAYEQINSTICLLSLLFIVHTY